MPTTHRPTRDPETELPRPDVLITSELAARYMGIPTDLLAEWRSKRMGPAYIRMTSVTLRYRLTAIEDWLAEHTVYPAAETESHERPRLSAV